MNSVSRQTFKKQVFMAVVPGLYLAAALYIDYLCSIGLLTPFFAVVGLLFMALVYRPWMMIPWAVVYTAFVSAIFLSPKLFTFFSRRPSYDDVIPIVQACTYVVVGALSCYLCVALNRVRRSEGELNHILENAPIPILTSDQNGNILYWNEPAEVLLPELGNSEWSGNYFDLLAPPEFHGRTILAYLQRFDQKNPSNSPLKLRVKGILYNGHVRLLEWSDKEFLLTMLEKEPNGEGLQTG